MTPEPVTVDKLSTAECVLLAVSLWRDDDFRVPSSGHAAVIRAAQMHWGAPVLSPANVPPAFDPDRPGCAPETCGGTSYDPCATVLRTNGARHDGGRTCSPSWEDATFSQVLAGDRLRLNGAEAECETSSVGQWHVKPGDHSWEYNGNTYWNDKPHEHPEVWLRLKGRDGRMQFPPNGPVQVLCDAERRAILDLQRASLNPSVNAPGGES